MTAAAEHVVDTGRLRLSVRDHPGGSPPVVALHGLASNARWWDLVGARLAPDHRLIAVDQRGHGRSDAPDHGYDFASVSDDLAALVDGLGLGPVVVAGHSWGASVALWYAAAHPEAVLGTICVDGGVFRLRDHFGDSWDLAQVAMRPPELEGLTAERVHEWAAASPLAQGSDAETVAGIMLGNLRPDASAATLRPRLGLDAHMAIAKELYHLDSEALLGRQSRPVLLVPADGGDLVAARHRMIDQALDVLGDRGEVRWIQGGHDLPVQSPNEVAEEIHAFAVRLRANATA